MLRQSSSRQAVVGTCMRMHVIFVFFFFGFIFTCYCEINNEIPVFEINDGTSIEENTNNYVNDEENITIYDLYQEAVHAYLEEDWEACVEGFEETRRRYREYEKTVIFCRRKCRNEADGTSPIFPENIGDMHFYEKKVKETLCLLMCARDHSKNNGKGTLAIFPREVETKLANHRDYEYLHICYFQTNRFQEAANAVFTFLVYYPGHKMSLRNLQHYLTIPNVRKEEIINMEIVPFVKMYISGVMAYENENYLEAITDLESSLRAYLKSEDECRLFCEGPFDQGWFPEFTVSLANHFTYCLQCKENCTKLLSTINGDYQSDLLASHYHYLQFAYYKIGKLKNACAAVESYLLFYPADETMLKNKKYYAALPKVKEDYFTPRFEAIIYIKRQLYETRLLRYISEEFNILSEENLKEIENEKHSEEFGQKSTNARLSHLWFWKINNIKNTSVVNKCTGNIENQCSSRKMNAQNVTDEKELNEKLRYVVEGFLNESECALLMKMAEIVVIEGDGYIENKSPHSKFEKFEGATIGRMALLVYFGLLAPGSLELLLRVTELIKVHVEETFNLNQTLYFTFTHLACRSPLPDSPTNRQDLSHKIHADNCVIINQRNCSRESPAYTWRDYSSILYLNDAFDGGEFIFAKDRSAKIIEDTVRPRCGRMVAFSADETNLHGVWGVTRGKRYAVALWFTHQKKYLEVERILAQAVLKRVSLFGPVKKRSDFQIPIEYEKVLVDLFMNDEKLQRFLEKW